MLVGILKEIKAEEHRVSMTPSGVEVMKQNGHAILVEHHAGAGSGFEDDIYVDAGAEIINDINALRYNLAMAKTIADYGAAVVLMHIRGKPKIMQKGDLSYHCVPGDMIAFLRERMETAESEGINANRIIIDPGIGFGKTPTDNMRMIRYLEDFNTLERPILVGVSRKSFIGHVVGGTPKERMEGTAAAVTAAVLNGAHIIRVHDVPFMKKVILMADAIRRA